MKTIKNALFILLLLSVLGGVFGGFIGFIWHQFADLSLKVSRANNIERKITLYHKNGNKLNEWISIGPIDDYRLDETRFISKETGCEVRIPSKIVIIEQLK